MSETDKSREAFEAWAKTKGMTVSRFNYDCGSPYNKVEAEWILWQAAWQAGRAAALAEAEAVCQARIMGDNNREDMESRRCVEAIRAIARSEPC